jgi:cytochrome c-type biogenesis protein CcmH/NrfG
MMPRAYVVAPLFLAALSGVLLVGMALRWKPVFFALLGASALRLALAVYAAVTGGYYGLVCGGAGVLVAIGSFLLVMQVQDDFWLDRKRAYFGLDRRSSAAARFLRAEALAERGMWALAALYLRAGIAKVPRQIGGHLRLARAYMQLNRPDLARQAIVTAQGIEPADPRVTELLAALEAKETPPSLPAGIA